MNNTGRPKKDLFPGKIKGDLYRFNVAESKYGNQKALPPTAVKFKNYVFNKKRLIYFFKLLYTVQNVKIVSMYNILHKNKCNTRNLFFFCLLSLLFFRWCLPYKRPTVISQHIWVLFASVFFPIRDIS
jgi:hypothetical protein